MTRQTISPRIVGSLPVKCPAGSPIGEVIEGSGVFCRIEHSKVTAVGHGRSLAAYCCAVYTQCPTWRAHREAEWAQRDEAMRDENRRAAA